MPGDKVAQDSICGLPRGEDLKSMRKMKDSWRKDREEGGAQEEEAMVMRKW